MAAVGRVVEVDQAPALVDVGDRKGVVVDAVVVLVGHVDRRVDQRRLDQRGAGVVAVDVVVEVAQHRHAAGGQRRRHRCAAHVLVIGARRIAPAVVLVEAVLWVDRHIVAPLVEIGVARQHPGARRDDVGLDAAVVGRAAARERRHLSGVAGRGVGGDRIGRIAPRGAIGEDRVLSPTAAVVEPAVARVVAVAIVLAGAHGDDVLGGAGRAHRARVDDAVGVRVGARVAGREQDRHRRVVPDEVVGVGGIQRVGAGGVAAP